MTLGQKSRLEGSNDNASARIECGARQASATARPECRDRPSRRTDEPWTLELSQMFRCCALVMAVVGGMGAGVSTAAGASTVRTIRTQDEQVVCFLDHRARYRSVGCTSDATLDVRPDGTRYGCSGPSALDLPERGRVRFNEICNPFWVPDTGQPITTLEPGQRLSVGQIRCLAKTARTLACWSSRSGHGFRLSKRRYQRY